MLYKILQCQTYIIKQLTYIENKDFASSRKKDYIATCKRVRS